MTDTMAPHTDQLADRSAGSRSTPVTDGELGLRGAPAVAVRALEKVYPGDVHAVKGIDFDVAPGEVFGLLGPNGAGKSTTIGMLTTTIAPTGGSACLAGFDVAREPLAARSVSAVVFQEAVVDGGLTGRRNLEIHARLWGLDPATASRQVAAVHSLGFTTGAITSRTPTLDDVYLRLTGARLAA